MRYRDRTHAGEVLAAELRERRDWSEPLVLALPRGGVPVAAPVAHALDADLDVLVVRKVGSPGRPELALGAIAEGSDHVVWGEVVGHRPPDLESVDGVVALERAELARRIGVYRGDRPPPAVAGRDVVVVDDGLATGATAEAALRSVAGGQARSVTLAVPVGPPATIERLAAIADDVCCPMPRADLVAVGTWYVDFAQTTDAEVLTLLGR
ncbi:phosphoribosyltransferase [Iamia sp. SCSIO 61187]|uniref:phosphoribosyltransferase n=1 Tax=Iamia sp. SCSIO 61187 TaxID=2722752 RepID=UPI001C63970A|nr:phosphoribosyltransferase family protein [Iamia sp. SCSIO 61187]QYG94012.1 phosphoribosyltransferase [Iamia sp. SCSIO 61187]